MKTGNYTPKRIEDLLLTFVVNWFSPTGRGHAARGSVSHRLSVFSYLLSAQNVKYRVVQGRCNNITHSWVEVENELFTSPDAQYTVYDPSPELFPVKEGQDKVYEPDVYFSSMQIVSALYDEDNEGHGPVLHDFSVAVPGDIVETPFVYFDFDLGGDCPPLKFTLTRADSQRLGNMLAAKLPSGFVERLLPEQEREMEEFNPLLPRPGEVWKHVKSGKDYFVIGVDNNGNAFEDDNNPPMIRYMGGNGVNYARDVKNWYTSFSNKRVL